MLSFLSSYELYLTRHLKAIFLFQCTSTQAVVSLPVGASLGSGFQLHVILSHVHVPRMWVEQHPTHGTHVCSGVLSLLETFVRGLWTNKEILV